MTYSLKLARGSILYLTVPQRFGIATASNPNRLPEAQFAAYFPSYWEPSQRRPLVVSFHGTTNPSTNPTYYKDMMGHLPVSIGGGSSGSIGTIGNGPDFALLANGSPVPVRAGMAAIGPTWADLAEKHNFAVICPRNFFAGNPNNVPFLGYGFEFDFASINCAKTAVHYLINTAMMVDSAAPIMGHGHSSGAGLLQNFVFRNPGYFAKACFAHGQALELTQDDMDYPMISGTRLKGKTWDWSEATGFTNVQDACPGGSTTGYNDASGACDLVAANYNYRSGSGLTALLATPMLVISGDNTTDGPGGGTPRTYCGVTDQALTNYGNGLGYGSSIFTVEYPLGGRDAFDGDPAICGPTIAVTGQRFYPHGCHDFAKTVAVDFFLNNNPTSTRYA